MKKCGIVTIWNYGNYGNRLQNYAVQQVLSNMEETDVYTLRIMSKKEILKQIKAEIKADFHFLAKGKVKNEGSRLKIFRKFNNRYIKCGFDFKKRLINKTDYIICGSDQIWNYDFAGEGYFFATFADPKKRISYSASFGVENIPQNKQDEYKKNLKNMKAISVREETGAKIVKDLSGKNATVLVDPTLMLTKKEWQAIAKKPSFIGKEKFILTYFLGDVSADMQEYINDVCSSYGYKLINLEMKNTNKFWHNSGPSEFIWMIENAEIVLTDSFHGTVFSVLMDTPFLVWERQDKLHSMSSRIDTLLSTLRLQDRRWSGQKGEVVFEKEYAHISEILQKERQKAIDFLKKAMEME
ncbi:MAG: polysaccharide pyruvyl transferase family protein [Clostridia bacterium]|nr:polysaccharide pyruvyl transferase family protein [Clostridia bacterium]